MRNKTRHPLCTFKFLHSWHVINIIKISNCIITISSIGLSLLLRKPEVLNTSLVVGIEVIRLDHFDRRLIYFWILCLSNRWSYSFLLTSKIASLWSTTTAPRTFICWWFILMSLIPSIIRSIVIQKGTSSHICRKSMTSFYFFEILLFAFNRVLIGSLTIRNRWHFRH